MTTASRILLFSILILTTGCASGSGNLKETVAEPAQEEILTEVDEILFAHLDATGGLERWKSAQNVVIDGVFEITGQGIVGSTRIIRQAPNLFVIVTDIGGLKTFEGHDGKDVWLFDSVNGIRVLEGDERTHHLAQGSLDRFLRWRDYYRTADVLPNERVDGVPARVVAFKYAGGGTEMMYFNARDNRLMRVQGAMFSPEGAHPILTDFREFRSVQGLAFPMQEEVRIGTTRIILVKKSIAVNVPIEQSFSPPVTPVKENSS
ncbi:hypothetical protein ACFL4G_07435 [Thermodesulfobacteriota bacterium]